MATVGLWNISAVLAPVNAAFKRIRGAWAPESSALTCPGKLVPAETPAGFVRGFKALWLTRSRVSQTNSPPSNGPPSLSIRAQSVLFCLVSPQQVFIHLTSFWNTPERLIFDPRVLSAVHCFCPTTYNLQLPTGDPVRPSLAVLERSFVGLLVCWFVGWGGGRLFHAGAWPWGSQGSLVASSNPRPDPRNRLPLVCFALYNYGSTDGTTFLSLLMHCTPSSVYLSVFLRTLAWLRPVSNPLEFGSTNSWRLAAIGLLSFSCLPCISPLSYWLCTPDSTALSWFHPSIRHTICTFSNWTRMYGVVAPSHFVIGPGLHPQSHSIAYENNAPSRQSTPGSLTQLVLWHITPSSRLRFWNSLLHARQPLALPVPSHSFPVFPWPFYNSELSVTRSVLDRFDYYWIPRGLCYLTRILPINIVWYSLNSTEIG